MKAIIVATLIMISVALAGVTIAQEAVYGDNSQAQSRAQKVYDSLSELGVQRVLVYYENLPRMQVYANEELGEGLCANQQKGRDFVSALMDLLEYDMPGLELYEVEVWYNDEPALRAQKRVGSVDVEFLK